MTAAARPHLHCYGLGYCAQALARSLAAEGWRISGTTRDESKLSFLTSAGFQIMPFAQAPPDTACHLLLSIPPEEAGDPVLLRHGGALAARKDLAWVGYLSTTGVYGDQGGAWVDESAAPSPTMARTERRVAAEQRWLDLARDCGLALHIFRLAGVYGPGRNQLETLLAGTARRIVKPHQVFSRIHLADIVQVLAASIRAPNPGAVYNVADDDPAPPQDVIAHAAELLALAPPAEVAFDAAELSPMARSFYGDNRRVRNDRIKAELGVELIYPSYRDGLAALAREMLSSRAENR